MREVEVDDDQFAQQQPQVARPDDEPQDIEEAPEDEAEPFVTQDCLDFFHVGVVRFVSGSDAILSGVRRWSETFSSESSRFAAYFNRSSIV